MGMTWEKIAEFRAHCQAGNAITLTCDEAIDLFTVVEAALILYRKDADISHEGSWDEWDALETALGRLWPEVTT